MSNIYLLRTGLETENYCRDCDLDDLNHPDYDEKTKNSIYLWMTDKTTSPRMAYAGKANKGTLNRSNTHRKGKENSFDLHLQATEKTLGWKAVTVTTYDEPVISMHPIYLKFKGVRSYV